MCREREQHTVCAAGGAVRNACCIARWEPRAFRRPREFDNRRGWWLQPAAAGRTRPSDKCGSAVPPDRTVVLASGDRAPDPAGWSMPGGIQSRNPATGTKRRQSETTARMLPVFRGSDAPATLTGPRTMQRNRRRCVWNRQRLSSHWSRGPGFARGTTQRLLATPGEPYRSRPYNPIPNHTRTPDGPDPKRPTDAEGTHRMDMEQRAYTVAEAAETLRVS